MIKLNLGSGTTHWKDFVNIDIDPKYKPDLVLDVTKDKLPYKNGSVDGIVINHSLEHFYKSEAIVVLKECYRVLKLYGTLILELPEIVRLCRCFLDAYNRNESYAGDLGINGFYGDTARYNNSIYQTHKWGWTEKSLREMLEKIGFKIQKVSNGRLHPIPQRNVYIEARKKPNRKVVFLPMSSINIYSARIRAYQVAEQLNKLGWDCKVGKEHLDNQSFVIFQKRYDAEYLKIAQESSGKVIFDMCDPYWKLKKHLNPIEEFLKEVDYVVTPTNKLALWFQQRNKKTEVIPDGFDFSLIPEVKKLDKFTIVWHGSRANTFCLKPLVKPLNRLVKEFGVKFRIIVNKPLLKEIEMPRFEFEPEIIDWKLETHLSEIAKCYIGVAPLTDWDWCSYKSANKIITYMALGLPVVCSLIPTYGDVVSHGRNGFIIPGNYSEDWYQALKFLIQNEPTRLSFIKEGKKTAQVFSAENIAKKWDNLLWSLTK